MEKVLAVTVKNLSSDKSKTHEFNELNELLDEGWDIIYSETINSNTSSHFTIVYRLQKN